VLRYIKATKTLLQAGNFFHCIRYSPQYTMKTIMTIATILAMASTGVCQINAVAGTYKDPNAPQYFSQEPWVKLWWSQSSLFFEATLTLQSMMTAATHTVKNINSTTNVTTTSRDTWVSSYRKPPKSSRPVHMLTRMPLVGTSGILSSWTSQVSLGSFRQIFCPD
jgi:hypothetical protein